MVPYRKCSAGSPCSITPTVSLFLSLLPQVFPRSSALHEQSLCCQNGWGLAFFYSPMQEFTLDFFIVVCVDSFFLNEKAYSIFTFFCWTSKIYVTKMIISEEFFANSPSRMNDGWLLVVAFLVTLLSFSILARFSQWFPNHPSLQRLCQKSGHIMALFVGGSQKSLPFCYAAPIVQKNDDRLFIVFPF